MRRHGNAEHSFLWFLLLLERRISVVVAQVCDGSDPNYGSLADGSCCVNEGTFEPIRFSSSLGSAVIKRSNLGGYNGRCSSATYTDTTWNSYNWGVCNDQGVCGTESCNDNGMNDVGAFCCLEDSDDNPGQPQDLYYNNVATGPSSNPIDLKITNLSPYNVHSSLWNGKDVVGHEFGSINLRSPNNAWGDDASGQLTWVALKFEFFEGGTTTPYAMTSYLSFYDFDNANNLKNRECIQFQGVSTVIRSDNTEVLPAGVTFTNQQGASQVSTVPTYGSSVVSGDPAWSFPDPSDLTEVYCSSQKGTAANNPSDSANLQELQKNQALMIKIDAKTEFIMRWSIDNIENPDSGGTGRNMLFAGYSDIRLPICPYPPSPPPPSPPPPLPPLPGGTTIGGACVLTNWDLTDIRISDSAVVSWSNIGKWRSNPVHQGQVLPDDFIKLNNADYESLSDTGDSIYQPSIPSGMMIKNAVLASDGVTYYDIFIDIDYDDIGPGGRYPGMESWNYYQTWNWKYSGMLSPAPQWGSTPRFLSINMVTPTTHVVGASPATNTVPNTVGGAGTAVNGIDPSTGEYRVKYVMQFMKDGAPIDIGATRISFLDMGAHIASSPIRHECAHPLLSVFFALPQIPVA